MIDYKALGLLPSHRSLTGSYNSCHHMNSSKWHSQTPGFPCSSHEGESESKGTPKALCSLRCRTQSDHGFRELLHGKQRAGLKNWRNNSFFIINWKCLWSQAAICISGLGWKISIKAMQNYLFSSPTEGQTDTMTNSESPEEKVAHFKELITISFP